MLNFFKKKNTLLYFSISILVLNILFLLYGITINSFLAAWFFGGLAAIIAIAFVIPFHALTLPLILFVIDFELYKIKS